MGRPSVKEKRTEEILLAFEKCVAKYGVEGSTLEKIAEAANLRRSLLRHYIGNKEELLDALVTRFLAESDKQIAQMKTDLTGEPANSIIEYLFYDDNTEHHATRVAHALLVAAPENKKLSSQLMKWADSFDEAVAALLKACYPQAKKADCEVVACGIVGICSNTSSLAPLGETQELRNASKEAAKRLLSTLN
ncbi:MAG: TetR/AcrR family transcriptional regulator [Kordiimonas sp.]